MCARSVVCARPVVCAQSVVEFCFGVSGVTEVFPIPGAGFAFEGCAITDSWHGVCFCGVRDQFCLVRGFAIAGCAISFAWCGVCSCGVRDQFCLVRGLLLRGARSVLLGCARFTSVEDGVRDCFSLLVCA